MASKLNLKQQKFINWFYAQFLEKFYPLKSTKFKTTYIKKFITLYNELWSFFTLHDRFRCFSLTTEYLLIKFIAFLIVLKIVNDIFFT